MIATRMVGNPTVRSGFSHTLSMITPIRSTTLTIDISKPARADNRRGMMENPQNMFSQSAISLRSV